MTAYAVLTVVGATIGLRKPLSSSICSLYDFTPGMGDHCSSGVSSGYANTVASSGDRPVGPVPALLVKVHTCDQGPKDLAASPAATRQ